MRQVKSDLRYLWRHNTMFKIAAGYLITFLLLVLLLPWLPLSHAPHELHLDHIYVAPFQQNSIAGSGHSHWLGTDALGRDVFSYSLYGARTALFISFPVMLLTTFVGLFLGTSAGFFGNKKMKVSRGRLGFLVIGFLLFCYFGFYLPFQFLFLDIPLEKTAYSLGILVFLLLLLKLVIKPLLEKWPLLSKEIPLPFDRVVLWLIETLTSIPRLIFIIVLASFTPPSVMLLSAILALTYWTGTARLARAEIIKIKQLPFFEAATALGTTNARILVYHALPNLLSPILISFTFGLASLMAFESTLSFLGIGVPADLISWGKMINGIRSNNSAWWIALFPGVFLITTVLSLQLCSYYYLNFIQRRKG